MRPTKAELDLVPYSEDNALRVLLIGSDNDMRSVIATSLLMAGHTVMQSEGTPEAMHLLRRSPYDLVIIDEVLPDGDGMTAIRSLRSVSGRDGLPIIFLTSRPGSHMWAMRAGATDIKAKPFHPLKGGSELSAFRRLRPASAPVRLLARSA